MVNRSVRWRHIRIKLQMRLVDFGDIAFSACIEDRFPQRGLNPVVSFTRYRTRLHQRIAHRRLKGRIRLFPETALLDPVEHHHRRHDGHADHQ